MSNKLDLNDVEDLKLSSQYLDLLSERVNGRAIACSDDWFASCENLVKSGRGVFEPATFVSTGQVMDGWESRRSFARHYRRAAGAEQRDWCVLRMGLAGRIRYFDIDTNHFRGNAPERVMVEATKLDGELDGEPDENTVWTTLLESHAVDAHSQNVFSCDNSDTWTHLKLSMFPDGGIARFRAYGEVVPNPKHYVDGELIDLASVAIGARGVAASDMFYSSPQNLTLPNRGVNMGDGWETKRRRDKDNDWAIIELGLKGSIQKVVIDTAHFKGNFPDTASLSAINADEFKLSAEGLLDSDLEWQTIIEETPLFADKEHLFISEINIPSDAEFTHVKLNIYPDGGVSRLRVFGKANWDS